MTDRLGYQKAASLDAGRRKPGRPAGSRPERNELYRLYVEESKSIREVADTMGCSKDLVYRTLEENCIDRRSSARRSKLRKYSLEFIRKEIKREGIGKTAEKLGVHRKTLWEYLREKESQ